MDCNKIKKYAQRKNDYNICNYLEIVEVVENGASSFVVR